MPGHLLPYVFTKPGFVQRQDCTASNVQQPTQCYDHHLQGRRSFAFLLFLCILRGARLSAGFIAAKRDAKAAAEANDAALDMQLNFVSV